VIVLLVSLIALVVIGRRVGRVAADAGESRATTATRGTLAAFALLVVVEAGLGAAGLLTASATAIALAVLAGAAFALRGPRSETGGHGPLTSVEAMLLIALLGGFALRFQAGVNKTSFLYDALSYHLHAPVTWMHEGRLSIVPAVFGDPAPAYTPGNMELWFLFLLSPLRSDYLAGVGQLPAAALAAVAIVAAVREQGGSRAGALGAALAFLLVPEIWNQIPTAMVDLGLAALLLASVPFVLRGELPTCAAALGLAIGTKYVGLVLALPFAVWALGAQLTVHSRARAGRSWRQALASLVILVGTAGFWYLRNAAITGNPLYPGAFPGLGLPALYSASAMRAWDYHIPLGDISMLFAMFVDASFGFAAAGVVGLVRAWRGGARALAVTAIALVVLFWCVVPYQESRFLFAVYGLAAIAVGLGVDRAPAGLARRLGWGTLVVAIVGPLLGAPTHARLLLIPVAALGACLPPLWARAPLRLRRLGLAGLVVAAAIGVAIGFPGYLGRDPGYTVGADLAHAWSWFRANVRDRRVAYTGNNLAFPLAGERLGNRVVYVNVAGGPGDRLHDFARRAGAGPGPDAEPALYRDGASFEVWWRNLEAAGAEVLFAAALEPIVLRNVDADADGFPIERAWADAHPDRFTLRFASPAARVYTIAAPHAMP
jgi:hypothetical protein